ncbi:TPA: hypothetical protein QCQ12_003107 [Bacillus cereus biovar anthracis]|nr:hypothetical protein [Bacillus cereus biovar anthracis]
MKIEVGDKVRMNSGKVGIVEEIFENGTMLVRTHATQLIMTSTYQVQEVIEKREKKMEYRGIEAYKALQEGKTLELGAVSKQYYKMTPSGIIYVRRSNEVHWEYSKIELNFFMDRKFVEYKEPLKHKVGDKILVEVEITRVEPDAEYPYTIARLPYAKESDVKGIDE